MIGYSRGPLRRGEWTPPQGRKTKKKCCPRPPPPTGSVDRTRPHREPHPSPATSPHANTAVNPGRSTVVRMPGADAHTAGTALTARFAV